MEKNIIDTVLKVEEKAAVDKISEMLKTLDDTEKSKMLIFMQGVNFAKRTNLATK